MTKKLSKQLHQHLATMNDLEDQTKVMMGDLGMTYVWPDESQIEEVSKLTHGWDWQVEIYHIIVGKFFEENETINVSIWAQVDIKTLLKNYQKKQFFDLQKLTTQMNENNEGSAELEELVVEALMARSFGLTTKVEVCVDAHQSKPIVKTFSQPGIIDLYLKNELVRCDYSAVLNGVLDGKYQLDKDLIRKHVWIAREEFKGQKKIKKKYAFKDKELSHSVELMFSKK
jgi:hypothetical protein